MLFPKNRVRFTTSYQGKTDAQGWVVLDLAGVDLDGVNKLYLSMADLTALQQAGDVASDRLKQARALLGGSEDDS
jgi:hypothetical protein